MGIHLRGSILTFLAFVVLWPTPEARSYQPVEGVSLWTFPANGAVPPNLRFLVFIGGMQDSYDTSMLLGKKPLLELVSFSGEVVPVKFVPGPQGLVEGIPQKDLEPSTYYRLRSTVRHEPSEDPGEEPTFDEKTLKEEAARVVWYVSLPRDEQPPEWQEPVTLTAAFFHIPFPDEHPAPEEAHRKIEMELRFSDAGKGPLLLFWTDAALESPDQIDFRRYQKVFAGSNTLCCFPKGDRVVRFELRDGAGHTSSPDPNLLAFGD